MSAGAALEDGGVPDLLEKQFACVPYECLASSFRTSQRQVEKELTLLAKKIAELGTASPAKAATLLDSIKARLVKLRMSVVSAEAQEQQFTDALERRLQRLLGRHESHEGCGDATNARRAAQRRRANLYAADFMLREGHTNSASLLASETGVDCQLEADILERESEIAAAIESRDIGPALSFCAEHKSRLRKLGSDLELRLHLQQFVHEVCARGKVAAVEYARANLTAHASAHRREVAAVMGCLAFRDPAACPVARYRRLFAPARWRELAEHFRRENRLLFGIPDAPPLAVALAAGLSALKTRHSHPRRNRYPTDASALDSPRPRDTPTSAASPRSLASSANGSSAVGAATAAVVAAGHSLPPPLPLSLPLSLPSLELTLSLSDPLSPPSSGFAAVLSSP